VGRHPRVWGRAATRSPTRYGIELAGCPDGAPLLPLTLLLAMAWTCSGARNNNLRGDAAAAGVSAVHRRW
jgi:hypothetical protein